MADQEFSSPGEHMASRSSGSSDGVSVAYRDPNNGSSSYSGISKIIYAPLNNSYSNNLDKFVHTTRDLDDYTDFSRSFNREYLNYNERMYNDAKSYDMMMSNTAIQRQVQDLIAAGLNPVLAAHLGGATYKGVNAPYVSLSPGSSLQAYTGYGSSQYATDVGSMTQLEVQQLRSDAQELTNQYNYVMNTDNNITKKDLVKLNQNAQEYLSNLNKLNDEELQQFGFENQKALDEHEKNLEVEAYKAISNFKFDPTQSEEAVRNFLGLIAGFIPFASGINALVN